jgi:hypothetical protein
MADGWFERPGRVPVRLLQAGLGAIGGFGVVTASLPLVVNAAVGLGVTVLPAVLRRDYRIALDPVLTLWVTLAAFLHAVGMMGPYDSVWWWDHLTHAFSAGFVAAVGYALTRTIDRHVDSITLPASFLFVYVFLFTVAAGVGWEVLEFLARTLASTLGMEAVLIQYSLEDTMLDLVFDMLGAVVVTAASYVRYAEPADRLPIQWHRLRGR